jgi:hypothetical protein
MDVKMKCGGYLGSWLRQAQAAIYCGVASLSKFQRTISTTAERVYHSIQDPEPRQKRVFRTKPRVRPVFQWTQVLGLIERRNRQLALTRIEPRFKSTLCLHLQPFRPRVSQHSQEYL